MDPEPGLDCPECSDRLVAGVCPTCHWKPAAPAQEPETPKRTSKDNVRCAWRGQGARCPLMASWYERGGDRAGFCTWHAMTLRDPRLDVFEEFERFCLRLQPHYCTTWAHYPPGALWDYVRGAIPLDALPLGTPCAKASCPNVMR